MDALVNLDGTTLMRQAPAKVEVYLRTLWK
jgi:hypothetical protein